MKRVIYILILGFSAIILTACISVIHLDGQILSNVDKEPIIGAQVILEVRNRSIVTTTDSLGYFSLTYVGGMPSRTHRYIVRKEGYKDFKIEFSRTRPDRILRISRGIQYHDLNGKRFYPDSTNLSHFLVAFPTEKYSRDFAMRRDSLFIYLDTNNIDFEFTKFKKRFVGYKME